MDNTQQFLKDMEKNFPGFCYYRMSQYDKDFVRDGKHVKSSWAILIEEDALQKWNNDTNKNSIFFTPNGGFRYSSGIRQKANATTVSCFMIDGDFDSEIKYRFREWFQYQPTAVVETKRWYHAYWVLKTPIDWATHQKKWNAVQQYLVDTLHGDTAAKDISRIMRLPWSTYWKNEEKWWETKCVHYNPKLKYELDEFFALISEEKIIADAKQFKKDYDNDSKSGKDLFDEIERDVNVIEVLEDLGGRWKLKWLSIYEDGELTGGYKYYKHKNAVVNFTKEKYYRPQWWPFAIAKFCLGSSWQAYHYFYTKYGIWEKKTVQITSQLDDVTKPVSADEEVTITTDTAIITISPETKLGTKINGKWVTEILIWYFRVIGFYKQLDDTHVYIIKYLKKNWWEWYINIKELASLQELTKIFSKVGITFLGSKNDFLHILEYIHSAGKQFALIDKLWLYPNGMLINKVGNYIYDESHYVACSTLNAKWWEVIHVWEDMSDEDFITEIDSLGESYEPKIIMTLFTMYGIYLFSEHIRRTMPFLPITILVWLTQSGKSSLRWSMMKMFGLDPSTETQASATEFSVMYMMNNFLPIHFCEFDNSVLKFDFDSFSKNTFDGTSSTRGTADQKLINYWFNAWLVVDGETRTLAPSVYTRSIMLFMNPRYKKVEKTSRKNVVGYFVKNYDKIHNINKAYEETKVIVAKQVEHIQSSEKTRIINNYSLLLAFAQCFGFKEVVQDAIIEQMKEQFIMKWEDNLDVYIKSMMNFASINRMPARFTAKEICIDLYFDNMKYDKKRTFDMQSNIQTVNHHFGKEWVDAVHIPLDYIFKNKNLHGTFNRYLNTLEAWIRPDYWTAKQAIKQFCDANNYKTQAYYESVLWF